jgi:hypothetical protein
VTYVQQQVENATSSLDQPRPLSSSILTAARKIYSSYCQAHAEPRRPVGVAIDRDSHRGHLIFTSKPILLPQECFVPFQQIEPVEQD